MRARELGALAFAAALAAALACGPSTDETAAGRICTPGAYVFCRCADRAEGSKLCKDDGRSFERCETSADGACVGGEVEDPDTGKPVPPPPVFEGGVPLTDNLETCPGKATAISPGAAIVIQGDTTGALDDQKGQGACTTGSGGPDHVYRLQMTGTGRLSVKVKGEGALNPTVYLRRTCPDETTQVACGETTGPAGLEQLSTNVVTGSELYLVVDGASGSAGAYAATIQLTTGTFCGDGDVTTNEACDDGNKVEGDGCGNDCQNVSGSPADGGGCPGQTVHLWPGRTVTGTSSTIGYGNTWNRTGNTCAVSTTLMFPPPEHVYEIVPHKTGNLTVSLTPDPGVNLMLVARRTCADPASQGTGMCSNDGSAGQAETMTFPVTDGEKVYVAVDGAGSIDFSGGYSVSFQLP